MIKRFSVLMYGVVCYAVFFATFLYAMGFVTNIFVPKSIDSLATLPVGYALAVNLGLLTLFAVQHSVMARPWFKQWWTRYVPQAMERSTYTLFSSVALIVLFYFWQPLGGAVWEFESPMARGFGYAVGLAGWLLVLYATFLINHFDLFGLRQVWLYFRGEEYTPPRFSTPVLYKYVRHPLYVGWFLAFWGTPTMTAAHLVFAMVTSAYIVVAVFWEEADLVAHHGERYAAYRRQVPKFLPRFRGRTPITPAEEV